MYKVCRELNIPEEVITMIGEYNMVARSQVENRMDWLICHFPEYEDRRTCIDICREYAAGGVGHGWTRHVGKILYIARTSLKAGMIVVDDPYESHDLRNRIDEIMMELAPFLPLALLHRISMEALEEGVRMGGQDL